MADDRRFEEILASFWAEASSADDPAHDLAHVRRVLRNALAIAAEESGNIQIIRPAAWFHDLVNLPKDHPRRKEASRLSADAARPLLAGMGYEAPEIDGICHAIEAHSFSAGIPPRTLEAKILQDADRLDALGAIGIARTFSTGGQLGCQLFDPSDPLAQRRPPDDGIYSLDHLYTKLLRLPALMHTPAARRIAEHLAAYMTGFAAQLAAEA